MCKIGALFFLTRGALMRLLCAVILLSITFLGLPSHSYATGNVLVPSTGSNGSPSSISNLGLTPQPAPTTNATLPTAPSGAPAPTTTLPNLSGAPLAYPPTASPTPSSTASTTLFNASGTTHIVQLPPALSGVSNSSLMPYAISFNGPEKYVWDSKDLYKINKHLGIPTNKIPELCVLSFKGAVRTNKGAYLFDTGISPHADAGYDGIIKNVTVRIQALCNDVSLPPNLGYVLQVGDKYPVALESISCPPPAANQTPRQITATYAGNQSTCQYR